ncbi:hypothetical protein JG687_00011612, partial [Phytophthora cactorum]
SIYPIVANYFTVNDLYWPATDRAIHNVVSRVPKHTLMKSREATKLARALFRGSTIDAL